MAACLLPDWLTLAKNQAPGPRSQQWKPTLVVVLARCQSLTSVVDEQMEAPGLTALLLGEECCNIPSPEEIVMTELKPNFLATAVGSMPHATAAAALDVIFDNIPEAPIWPQLPARGMNEQMEIQYSEGMPCRVIDREKSRMYFDTSGDFYEAFGDFYEAYAEAMDPDEGTGDCSAMAISADFAAGLHGLLARLEGDGSSRPFVKCHTTGPCSFSLTIVDENKRALYYNEEFRDMIVKALAMKCRWQIQRLEPYADRVICFVDEPILAGFGSSTYISVQRDDVVALLAEMVEAIHSDGALAGVHCCGNTEWSILVDAGVDVVSFDAFEFGETIAMYPGHVRRHLEQGKALAWGLVPTSAEVMNQTVDSLVGHYEEMVDKLSQESGLQKQLIHEQTMLTGSCGTGTMEVQGAERVYSLTRDVSRALRDKHGG